MIIDHRGIRWAFPRFSLRLLLIVLTCIAVFVALRRERLRAGAEAAWARLEDLLTAESDSILVNGVLIPGPIISGAPAVLDPPSPHEIATALQKKGGVNKVPPNARMILEPLATYVDPPRVYPQIGPARLHHAHYKCMIYSDNSERMIYIDHNHFCKQ